MCGPFGGIGTTTIDSMTIRIRSFLIPLAARIIATDDRFATVVQGSRCLEGQPCSAMAATSICIATVVRSLGKMRPAHDVWSPTQVPMRCSQINLKCACGCELGR
eukprot:520203-Amphidinium_carterae.1